MTFDQAGLATQKEGQSLEEACLLLDQIKREKGVWWMPWQ